MNKKAGAHLEPNGSLGVPHHVGVKDVPRGRRELTEQRFQHLHLRENERDFH